MEVQVCSNCDEEAVAWRCLHCPADFSFLCDNCCAMHKKTKAFRSHCLEPSSSSSCCSPPVCRNCEQAESKFVCLSCGDDEKFLCLGCSLLHPKIKRFRGHLVVMSEESSRRSRSRRSLASLWTSSASEVARTSLLYLKEVLEDHVHTLVSSSSSSTSCSSFDYWCSVAAVVGLLAGYYLVVKALFRSYALVANTVVALVLLKFYQPYASAGKRQQQEEEVVVVAQGKRKDKLLALSADLLHLQREGPKKRKAEQQQQEDEKEEERVFEEEFGYKARGKAAAFRPRGRAYRPRQKQQPSQSQ